MELETETIVKTLNEEMRQRKFPKVYSLFYLEDDGDLPHRWVVEPCPYWVLCSNNGTSLISELSPYRNSLTRVYQKGYVTPEPDKNLFSTVKAGEEECEKRNKKRK